MSAATAGSARRSGASTPRSTARRRELSLLIGATLVGLGAAALLQMSVSEELPLQAFVPTLAVAASALVAHVTIRQVAPDADAVLLPLATFLNMMGLVFVRRVDLVAESDLATTQTLWSIVSIAGLCALLLAIREVRQLGRYQYSFGLLTIVLLLLPLVPGITAGTINGAQLWVRVAGMTFQPGELAKLTMMVFLAGYLERNRALLSVATQRIGPLLLPAPRYLAPVFVAAGAALVIMAGLRDLGSALLFFSAFVAMLYIATGRPAYPALGALAFGVGSFIAYQLFSHVRVRVSIWLDPWSQVQDAGYQLAQTLFAFGTGGLTGTGLGFGRPQDIPFSETDAIFAVVGEELGLLGASALLLAYVLLTVRGFKIALTARDEFGTLLAVGLTVTIAVQTFVIIGGLTRLVPLTGITLPFISYGGSSLLANFLLVGLLLRIGDESRSQAFGRPTGGRAGERTAARGERRSRREATS
ncbi:FtsW/RodA/SpoVE family cell cycle protein [Nitriliruptoraceae bacterium ZYF776]|nr:FtsW/RodA/SpoVE family cell cycle protein [Profundirhabdus halotolerans]